MLNLSEERLHCEYLETLYKQLIDINFLFNYFNENG